MLIPKQYQKVVDSIIKKSTRYNTIVKFNVKGLSGGSFTTKELLIGETNCFDDFILTLLHESCHLDQSTSKSLREQVAKWDYSYRQYFSWLEKKKNLSTRTINKHVKSIIECELDCERRVVNKIRKFNLPIDKSAYIKKANIYIASYVVVTENRKWYKHLCLENDLIEKSSDKFLKIGTDEFNRLASLIREKVNS